MVAVACLAGWCEVKRYCTIVADPPWHYDDYATMPGNAKKQGHTVKRPDLPYESMTVAEVAELPVSELVDKNAFVYLWTTNKYLPESFEVLKAWGLQYRQTLVWHKTGNPSPFGGTVAPNHAEFLLVGVKGSPRANQRMPGSVITAPKPYEHSRKPDVVLDLIEAVGPGPYLEMFARRARFLWDYWGNESLETAEVA